MLRIEPGSGIHTPRTRAARDGAVYGLHGIPLIPCVVQRSKVAGLDQDYGGL